MKVELRYATLPSPLGLFSAHYWFVVWDADGSHRWEVWQKILADDQVAGPTLDPAAPVV